MRHVYKSALIGFVMLASAASAVFGQGRMDCASAYRESLNRLRRQQLPPERMIILSRQALRIYDACQTHDLRDPKALFQSLDRWKD